MDHYTVLRCHVAALERWAKDHPNDRSSVDISEFSISPLLAEAFKRVDPHRYVLLASDGCVHLLASTNAPVPAEFKHKRYMKSNPRSNIRDVVQVLYNLLGVSVVQGSSDLAGFIRLLNFFISFQIENEEMVNLNVCSEWFHSIRRQFLQGPSFETPEVWKAKYRNPAIKGLYDSVAKQEQIDTLSSFVDKQATILFSMNSESLDAQLEALRSSATEVRALVEEKSGEIEALKKLLARYDEELDEFSTILGDLHGKVKNLQKEPAAKEAVQVVAEVVQEAAAEVVQEAAAEVVQEAAAEVVAEVVQEAAAEAVAEAVAEAAVEVVAEAAVEVSQEAAAEVVAEAAVEVSQEAAAEVVAEAAVEVSQEAAAEAAVEVVAEVVAEAAVEVSQEAAAEAAVEVSQEAVAEVVAEAAVEVAQEAAAEAAVEVSQEAVAEVVAEAAVEVAQEAAAEAAVEAVAEVAAAEVVQEAAPEAVQEAAAEVAQESAAEVAQESAAEVAQESAPEAVQEAVAEVAQESAPEAVQEAVAEVAQEAAAEAVQEAVAEVVQEAAAEASEAEEAAPEIVEPPSLVEAEIEHEPEAEPSDQEDDIELSRIGSHFVIKGTRVVVSIQDGSAIGFLDESNVLHKEESEEVKSACESYGLLFA
jgi:hypothetical protein